MEEFDRFESACRRFVTKEECAEHRRENAERFESVAVALAEIRTTQKISIGILGTIGAAAVAIAMKLFFGN